MKFNKLIPELSVRNIQKSLDFYINILKFKINYERKECKFAFISMQNSQIMLEEINNFWKTANLKYPFGRGMNLQIEVRNSSNILKSLKKNKYPIFKKQKINWYRKGKYLLGTKEFLVQDPDGYLLRFSENIGKKKI